VASVERKVGPALRWCRRAIGGPPIDVDVPMSPDAKPAERSVPGVGRRRAVTGERPRT
jgi:hypothetical protein